MSRRQRLKQLKHSIRSNPAFTLGNALRWKFAECFRNIRGNSLHRSVVSWRTSKSLRGTVLLSYMLEPFLNCTDQLLRSHSRNWEALQMARTFLELGYDVDAISWRNDLFQPMRDYDVVIDVRYNMQRWARSLPAETLKIFHIDAAHMLFHNAAEANRLLALQQRRGVTLNPRRFERPNLGIEHADYGTILGNDFTVKTYEYSLKPFFRLPIPSAFTHPWLDGKEWERCRRHFLFFSSGGLVHKGLDLALEVFANLPECQLTVCVPIDDEPDFKAAYSHELFELPNIHTLGWVDTSSPRFLKICRDAGAVISPSCSEGTSGALVTCLHAGLVPIASYQSGVDLGRFGLPLQECSLAEIRKSVEQVSAMAVEELEGRAREAWGYARLYHTREGYAKDYRGAVCRMLAAHHSPAAMVSV